MFSPITPSTAPALKRASGPPPRSGCGATARRWRSNPIPSGTGQGGVITAVDLVRGLAVLCGLEVIQVPGATGWIDTNYEGKAQAAIDCLQRADFVYVHVEAPDECGHKGMAEEKVRAIENFDRRIVAPVWAALEAAGEPYRLIVCTDHRTPVLKRGHTSDPVPFAWVDGPLGVPPPRMPPRRSTNSCLSRGRPGWCANWCRNCCVKVPCLTSVYSRQL
jgi:hypothetical protein